MSSPIEDYALIGDCLTAGLVARNGSLDWLCFPRFDSGACFAALLGTPDHGRWLLAPRDEPHRGTRRYRERTLILETTFETAEGAVTLVDCMPPRVMKEGFVKRYPTESGVDGLPPAEGAFLACTFWLANNYALLGQTDKARAIFLQLPALRNDVGLLAEEYDVKAQRLVGNFPQASPTSALSTRRTILSMARARHSMAAEPAPPTLTTGDACGFPPPRSSCSSIERGQMR
jgi:GH15 family glucan-1,4-alpha-glucosidase